MPYPGIPKGSAAEKKLERCVRDVMARQKKDKSSAIAICRASIKKEVEMARKVKQQEARQRRKANQRLKAEIEALDEQEMLEEEFDSEIGDEELLEGFEEFLNEQDDLLPETNLEETKPQKALKENIPSMSLDELTPTGEQDAKMMYMDMAEEYRPFGGATSLEEADLYEEQEEKARQIRKVTYKIEAVSGNIVKDENKTLSQKAAAYSRLGKDLASRTVDIVNKDFEDELELAEVDTLLNYVGILDRIESAAKAKLSTASRNDLPDSAFACIKEGKRHYPIHDKAHVRNALARVSQGLKKGGDAAALARCAKPKVMAAAKKMGIGQEKPSKELPNHIFVEKDTEGQWRWTGWVSNNFVDREGEIITEQAHKDYVAWLDQHPEMAPEFWVWHTKGTNRKSPVDFWDYVHGFLIMSGPLTEDESLRLLQASSKERLGMSHGFIIIDRNKQDSREITKYRTYEVSDLPLSRAANPFTNLETHNKENNSMSTQKMEYLVKLLGEERATKFLEETEEKQTELNQLGVQSKDTEEQPKPAAEPQTTEKDDADFEKLVEAIANKVLEKAKIPQLSKLMEEEILPAVKAVGDLQEGLKDLKGEEEEKVSKIFEPPVGRTLAWERPSESEDNLTTKEEKEKSTPGIPEEMWLSKATGIAPILDAEGGA